MLLWLTLALLWSPTCWARQMCGYGRGPYFIISKDNDDEITGIRVFIGPLGLIKSIQVRFGSSWSEKYGIPDGKPHEFLLLQNEHITKIYRRCRTFLQHMTLFTYQGLSASFGKEVGKGFFAHPESRGQVLKGISRRQWLYGHEDWLYMELSERNVDLCPII